MCRGSRTKFEHGPITMAEMTISKKTETDAGDSIYDDDSDDNDGDDDDDDDDDDDIVSQPGGDRDNKKTRRADTSSPVPIQMKTCCVKIKAGENSRL